MGEAASIWDSIFGICLHGACAVPRVVATRALPGCSEKPQAKRLAVGVLGIVKAQVAGAAGAPKVAAGCATRGHNQPSKRRTPIRSASPKLSSPPQILPTALLLPSSPASGPRPALLVPPHHRRAGPRLSYC